MSNISAHLNEYANEPFVQDASQTVTIILLFSFNLQSDTLQNVYKYYEVLRH